jgi:hypothetical protein
MMFSEAESLALFTLILVCKVFLLVEELALLDWVCDPPGLKNISLEKVLWGQWIIDWLQLVSETLMEFRQNTTVFLNDDAQLTLLFVLCILAWVRDVKH